MRDKTTASRLSIDTSTPAVVLKFDPNVMHHGGLGVIRSLGRLGVPVYGVHEDSLAPAAHSRYLRGYWLWHPSPEDVEATLAGLAQIANHIGRPSVLLPTDDAAAIFLAEHANLLREWFLFSEPQPDLLRRLAGKHSLYQLCRALGVPSPETILVGEWEQAEEFADRVGFPLIGKLATPWLSAGAAKPRSTSILRTQEELAELYQICQANADGGLTLQEFIPSGDGYDWFFHAYCDANSRCRPACTGVKERSYPTHAGLTSLGRSAENVTLQWQASELLARLGFRGIVDLDFRWDVRDGEYKLLDFNPRLGAQFRLFQDASGIDVALAAYLDLTGQDVEVGAPRSGRRYLVENYDPVASFGYWRDRELGLKSWTASVRDVDEVAWFATDDLVPFGLMSLWMGWRGMTRPFVLTRKHGPAITYPDYRLGRNDGTKHRARRSAAGVASTAGGGTGMNDIVDVAIVGAGPYGLSLAAHLRGAGVSYRQFGIPMGLWRNRMPRGMYLKSQGFASNLSDPDRTHTLKNFCQQSGRTYADYGVPVSLDTFLAYGQWFQEDQGLDVEQQLVADVAQCPGYFTLTLANGDRARARNVVIAVGVEHFARIPDVLAELPEELCTHSSAHDDLSGFAGREVVVIGAGQSALEAAALLHENGTSVRLFARAEDVVWNGAPLSPERPLLKRMREPEAGLGSGLSTWFYSEHPRLFRHLPGSTRAYRARTALGPAGAWWLRERVEGKFPVHLEHELEWAKPDEDRARLGFRGAEGEIREIAADHVISATGFPPRLDRLSFLNGRLRSKLRTHDGTPRVGRNFQSSVPGLFFVGAAVAPTFGPVMRFVYGSDFAVRKVADRLVAASTRKTHEVGRVTT